MKKTFLLLALGLSFKCSNSQVDSIIYFDLNWEKASKANASFYRESLKDGVLWHVNDYYQSGQLQMEGNYSSFEPDIQEGYFIWYYESGQKYAEGNFDHGKRDGDWTFWFPDGLKKEELSFSRNEYIIKWQSKRIKVSRKYLAKAKKMKRRRYYPEAMEQLNIALEINPYDEVIFFERGLIQCLLKNIEAGCKDFIQARDYMYPNNFEVNQRIMEYCD